MDTGFDVFRGRKRRLKEVVLVKLDKHVSFPTVNQGGKE